MREKGEVCVTTKGKGERSFSAYRSNVFEGRLQGKVTREKAMEGERSFSYRSNVFEVLSREAVGRELARQHSAGVGQENLPEKG